MMTEWCSLFFVSVLFEYPLSYIELAKINSLVHFAILNDLHFTLVVL
jgi:hypothetical protein